MWPWKDSASYFQMRKLRLPEDRSLELHWVTHWKDQGCGIWGQWSYPTALCLQGYHKDPQGPQVFVLTSLPPNFTGGGLEGKVFFLKEVYLSKKAWKCRSVSTSASHTLLIFIGSSSLDFKCSSL